MPYIAHKGRATIGSILMTLHSDFEGLHGIILHHNPRPTIESVVHEFIVEETPIKSPDDKGSKTVTTPAVFAIP